MGTSGRDLRVSDPMSSLGSARRMEVEDVGVEQGESVLAEAVDAFGTAFGPRMVAAYALGSLANGGFSSLVSDVDLAVVLAGAITDSDDDILQRVTDAIKTGPTSLHQRLSVFWGTPATWEGQVSGGRFPPLDRLDLIEHGRLLFGGDIRDRMPAPARDELLIVGAEFALDFLGDRLVASQSGLGSMTPSDDALREGTRGLIAFEARAYVLRAAVEPVVVLGGGDEAVVAIERGGVVVDGVNDDESCCCGLACIDGSAQCLG